MKVKEIIIFLWLRSALRYFSLIILLLTGFTLENYLLWLIYGMIELIYWLYVRKTLIYEDMIHKPTMKQKVIFKMLKRVEQAIKNNQVTNVKNLGCSISFNYDVPNINDYALLFHEDSVVIYFDDIPMEYISINYKDASTVYYDNQKYFKKKIYKELMKKIKNTKKLIRNPKDLAENKRLQTWLQGD